MIPNLFVFSSVSAIASANGEVISFTWLLRKEFQTESSTLNFYVEAARAGGDFIRLNAGSPVVNANTYTFTNTNDFPAVIHRDGLFDEVYFRVALEVDGQVYYSIPVKPGYPMEPRDLAVIKEIVRRKYVQMSRARSGIPGYLLRRRRFGTQCNRCFNEELKATTDSNCPVCYGTGFEGGFDVIAPFYVEPAYVKRGQHETGEAGVERQQLIGFRCVLWPEITESDIWVPYGKQERYKIGNQLEFEVRVRDVGVIAVTQMDLIAQPNGAYLKQVDETQIQNGTVNWTAGISLV